MSYQDLLQKENMEHNYLAVLTLKRKIQEGSWTLTSGDIYEIEWPYGPVSDILALRISSETLSPTGVQNTVEMRDSFEEMVSGYEGFYDADEGKLYVRGISPDLDFTLVSYKIFLSTKPVNWYVNPLDVTSAQIHYEGLIERAPTVQHSQVDSVFGFVPRKLGDVRGHTGMALGIAEATHRAIGHRAVSD